MGNGGDVVQGGVVSLYWPIGQFWKVYAPCVLGGYAPNGNQIFKKTTVDWLLVNHASAISITYFNPQAIGGQLSADIYTAFNGGTARFNTDLCAAVYYGASPTQRFWGGALGTYGAFDTHTGLYCYAGTCMFGANNFPSTVQRGNTYSSWRNMYGMSQILQVACQGGQYNA